MRTTILPPIMEFSHVDTDIKLCDKEDSCSNPKCKKVKKIYANNNACLSTIHPLIETYNMHLSVELRKGSFCFFFIYILRLPTK